MRCNIFLLLLMFGFYYSVLGQDSSESKSSDSSSGSSDQNSNDQNADDSSDDQSDDVSSKNQNDTNDDDTSGNVDGKRAQDDFYYPCKNPEDIVCVRTFFMRSYQCVGAAFDDRQPVYRERHTAYVPKVNLTAITSSDVITFSGSKIETLYLNRRTNNLVMAVSFEGIKLESGFAYYVINQRDQEPVIAGDAVNITYGYTTLTAVIPIGNRIDMRQASVHAYNYDANPTYQLGPNLANSSNPVVEKTIKSIISNLATVVQEVFLTEAYSYFMAYMQSHVCFFGIPLST